MLLTFMKVSHHFISWRQYNTKKKTVLENFFMKMSTMMLLGIKDQKNCLLVSKYWHQQNAFCQFLAMSPNWIRVKFCAFITPFVANVFILYLLSKQENFWFSDVFRRYKMGTLSQMGSLKREKKPPKNRLKYDHK